MEIKLVEEKLLKAIETNDESNAQEFIKDLVELFTEQGITKETTALAINGIDIDSGVNFLDAFNAMEPDMANETWEKVIRKTMNLKNSDGEKCIKLLCGFAASSFGGESNTVKLLGSILNSIIQLVKECKIDKKTISETILFHLLGDVPSTPVLPEWNSISKMTSENKLRICEMLDDAFSYQREAEKTIIIPAQHVMKLWITSGREYAEMDIEIKEKSKNKLPKLSDELLKLAEHYKILEEEYDKTIHELAINAIEIRKLHMEIQNANTDYREALRKIAEQETIITELNKKILQAQQEVSERKTLNDAQEQYRVDAMDSMKEDIAKALKAEYGDYIESKDAPMSDMLGEIYREKLKQVFKILEQKGIKVDK